MILARLLDDLEGIVERLPRDSSARLPLLEALARARRARADDLCAHVEEREVLAWMASESALCLALGGRRDVPTLSG